MSLVLVDEDHISIPNTSAFVPLTYSPLLNISVGTTSIQALEFKDAHGKNKHIYLECKNSKKALFYHI